MYRHVVVGTDGSDTATRAVEAAARTAQAHRAELTVAHAFVARPAAVVAGGLGDVPDELRWRLTPGAAADSIVERAIERAHHAAGSRGLVVHGRREPGQPVAVLLDLITELPADAVVVGNRDLTTWLGARHSVGRALSRHAPCDVIIAHTVGRRSASPARTLRRLTPRWG